MSRAMNCRHQEIAWATIIAPPPAENRELIPLPGHDPSNTSSARVPLGKYARMKSSFRRSSMALWHLLPCHLLMCCLIMPQVASQTALPDKYTAVYVLLAGIAGGLVLAVVVMVCCKVCLRKKKTTTRQHAALSRSSQRQHNRARKYHSIDSAVSVDLETSCGYPDSSVSSREIDAEDSVESGIPSTWSQTLPESVPGTFAADIELRVIPKGKAVAKDEGQPTSPEEASTQTSSPERPPEVTSAVRRRSSVGIQRQASVCLSDEDEDEEVEQQDDENSPSSESESTSENLPGPSCPEVTKVAAVVHRSSNEKPYAHSWDQTSVGSTSSQPIKGVRHPPFIHSHSSPDSASTATVLEIKHGKLPSTISLRGVAADNLARVVDLEEYHYSKQQVWELASQGATLLKERSQSSLDVASGSEGWEEIPSRIQQATSTEAGLLEQGLEQHQLENLRILLRRYSPVDEEESQLRCKVRYNDTGSREDIREEVMEMISAESEDESSSSVESEIVKQQYRKLWELRASLEEEEEELSEPQHVEEQENLVSPYLFVEEQELLASLPTSFDSNADVIEKPCDDGEEASEDYAQVPTHELRRHCYKSLLTKRLQRRTPGDPRTSGGGTESSLDSVDSSSTDRTEGATTSFESTTDNTDSTGEGQTNRLQQMKADSGYKSMESNGKAPRLSKKQLQFALDGDSLDAMLTLEGSLEEEEEIIFEESVAKENKEPKTKCITDSAKQILFKEEIICEAPQAPVEKKTVVKTCKSALKKHRSEGDTKCSDQTTLPDITSETKGKSSVFQRFFRSGRLRFDQLQITRDYSIDEKSDALFREFSRTDVHEAESFRSRGSRLHGHIRLHHRPLPPAEGGSPRLGRKVLSPQLSIEEESCESSEEQIAAAAAREQQMPQCVGKEIKCPHETQAQIPVICLAHGKGERPI